MVDVGEEGASDAERVAAGAAVGKNAWRRTIEEMKEMATELEDSGWEAVAVAAGDTAPKPPGAGADDRFGLIHVIPDNYAEAFSAAIETGEFPVYEVFRETAGGRVYLITRISDPETATAILIAGQYETRLGGDLASVARERGTMYTHVQTLDGTRLGSFEHDEPSKFFPERVYEATER